MAQGYANACADMNMTAFDCIGGWLAIFTPRFLYRYAPDTTISAKVYRELMQLLPRVISEHLQWLLRIWKKRCTLVHTGDGTNASSQLSSQTSSSQQSLTTLPSLRTTNRSRTRRRNRRNSSPSAAVDEQAVQTSILPFTADQRPEDIIESDMRPLSLSPMDEDNSYADLDLPVRVDNQLPLIGTQAPDNILEPTQPTSPAPEGAAQGRGRFTLWNLRGSTQLYEYPSNCPVQPVARRWEDLNGVYIPALEGLGYNLPSTINLRIGPSLIPDAGNGLFLDASMRTFLTGTVIGTYWGPDTINHGLPLSLFEPGAGIPNGVRDDGGYLLRHGDYMVEADPDCAMGYINEGWEDANASFQPNPGNS